MLNVTNILVPRDFSDGSDQALAYARTLATLSHATIHALHVQVLYEDPYSATPVAKEALEGLEQRLIDGVEGLTVTHAVERDVAPAPAIVAYAEDNAIDLIVMGTHGRRGLRRLLLGSVAEEVVRTAPCPVLTVRYPDGNTSPEHIKRILVPTDFSKHARAALIHARELASLFDAHIDLLHVIEEQLHPAFYNTGVTSIYDVQPDIEEKAAGELKRFFEETDGAAAQVRYHVRHGHAAREIVTFAAEEASDLVVMSTHGLRGLEHFLIGSVADKVVRRAPAPVLTLKSFGKSLLASPETASEEAAAASPS